MRLAQYLEEKKVSAAEFASAIGVSDEAIRLYVLGKRIPRRDLMQTIREKTHGLVTPDDFYDAPLSHAGAKPRKTG